MNNSKDYVNRWTGIHMYESQTVCWEGLFLYIGNIHTPVVMKELSFTLNTFSDQ